MSDAESRTVCLTLFFLVLPRSARICERPEAGSHPDGGEAAPAVAGGPTWQAVAWSGSRPFPGLEVQHVLITRAAEPPQSAEHRKKRTDTNPPAQRHTAEERAPVRRTTKLPAGGAGRGRRPAPGRPPARPARPEQRPVNKSLVLLRRRRRRGGPRDGGRSGGAGADRRRRRRATKRRLLFKRRSGPGAGRRGPGSPFRAVLHGGVLRHPPMGALCFVRSENIFKLFVVVADMIDN